MQYFLDITEIRFSGSNSTLHDFFHHERNEAQFRSHAAHFPERISQGGLSKQKHLFFANRKKRREIHLGEPCSVLHFRAFENHRSLHREKGKTCGLTGLTQTAIQSGPLEALGVSG